LAVPAAVSVIVEDGVTLYWLAAAGAFLAIVWWLLEGRYQRVRDAAQAARRAGLIANGLPGSFSPGEHRDLREKFVVTEDEASAAENPDYYASEQQKGPGRLAEMIEESSFYTARLQEISAFIMRLLVAAFGVGFIVLALAAVPLGRDELMMTVIRVAFAIFVFVLSSDVYGAMRRHSRAASGARDVYRRLCNARAIGYPQPDVLLALSDYNAIIEAAPESVPFAYEAWKDRLNTRWREYQADCWPTPGGTAP